MFSTMGVGRSIVMSTAVIAPVADTRTMSGNDEDARRRARQRIRDETRRILVDFREAERDRRRPEYRRRQPVRMALKVADANR